MFGKTPTCYMVRKRDINMQFYNWKSIFSTSPTASVGVDHSHGQEKLQ
jgi:hypothetical protein